MLFGAAFRLFFCMNENTDIMKEKGKQSSINDLSTANLTEESADEGVILVNKVPTLTKQI